jgi:hypothetical protein
MALPAWLPSQQAARAANVLAAAADQFNLCRTIAATLHAQGREHHNDPTWQAAAAESSRLNNRAESVGFDEHAVAAEADRRRSAPTPAPAREKTSRVRINLGGRKK